MTEQKVSEKARPQLPAIRLPFPPEAHQAFGLSQGDWKVLVESTFPNAQSDRSVLMALAYCRQRGLDIFKRPIHIVPIYDSRRKAYVETVWPGISELRTTAMRTQAYAGRDPTEFGPTVTIALQDAEDIAAPEWARMTVYRKIDGDRVPYPGPTIYWRETYATLGYNKQAKRPSDAPNAMWRRKPSYMLEKCAEAAALRSAFPEELGGDIAAEEINPNDASVLQASPSASGVYSVADVPEEKPQRKAAEESPGDGAVAEAEPESEESGAVATDADSGVRVMKEYENPDTGDLSEYIGDLI